MQASNYAEAWQDLSQGFRKSWIWTALALQDIKLRYRGSVLGPFWLTVSMVVWVASMGLIYAQLLRMNTADYLTFLTFGLIVWQFISTVINEGCETFLNVSGVIQQVAVPFSIHAYRVVFRNLVVMAHNLVIVPFVMAIFSVPINWYIALLVPAFLILAVNGMWASLLFGTVSTRFRDIPPIVGSFLQVAFFATPIIWSPSLLGDWQNVAELNPLFAMIDVVRAPLLGAAPAKFSWVVLSITTIIGCAASFAFFARFRSRIPYWL